MLKQLTEDVWVGGQITQADLAEIKRLGIASAINNRPDNEVPGQPSTDALGAQFEAAGIDYVFLPMDRALSAELVEGSTKAFAELSKPILAFCASGTRSTVLWCFANVNLKGVDAVLEIASSAGYQIGHMRPALEAYASQ